MPRLNQRQRAAVEAPQDRPLKIIAGAGTGKTETLAQRFVALVDGGLHPSQIVMLTFTEKAAAEMRGRVIARLLEADSARPVEHLLHLWIHTFHGFCARLLADHTLWLGLATPPPVLEPWQTAERLDAIWDDFRSTMTIDERWGSYNPGGPVAYQWHKNSLFPTVRTLIEQLRALGFDQQALFELRPPSDYERTQRAAYRQLRPLAAHCFASYVEGLRDEGALDFGALIASATELLRQDALAQSVRARFGALLVDEFQDTDRAQLELLALLDPGFTRTAVVGDPRQAIYGWRQARVENIIAFPEEAAELTAVALRDNYRSRETICELANLALHGYQFTAHRAEFDVAEGLLAARDDRAGQVVQLLLSDGPEAEAAFVAATAAELHGQGFAYGSMALLLRSRTAMRAFEDALLAAGIPYELGDGPGFFDQAAVRQTLALLRLLDGTSDEQALLLLLESALVGVPDALLALVRRPPGQGKAPLPRPDDHDWLERWQAAIPDGWPGGPALLERLERFAAIYAALRGRMQVCDPPALLEACWELAGLRADLLRDGSPEARRQLLSLDRLLLLAEDYAADPLATCGGLWRYLSRRASQDSEPLPSLGSGRDALQILTVHGSKGREFPIVFLADTRIPRHAAQAVASVLFDERLGLVISSKADKHAQIKALRDEVSRRALNEERCIWYVALTRARDRLYVLHDGRKCAPEGDGDGLVFSNDKHFFHELWNILPTIDAPWASGVERIDARAHQVTPPARSIEIQDEPALDASAARALAGLLAGRLVSAGPPPVQLSFSAWDSYQLCPHQYRVRFLLRWEKMAGALDDPDLSVAEHTMGAPDLPPGAWPQALGLALHRALAYAGRSGPDLESCLSVFVDELQRLVGDERPYLDEGERVLGLALADRALWSRRPHPADLERRVALETTADGQTIRLTGVIDRLDRGPGRWRIIDYKWSADLDLARAERQLGLYTLMLRELLPDAPPIDAAVYDLRRGQLIAVPTPPEADLRAGLATMAAELSSPTSSFARQPGVWCARCPVRRVDPGCGRPHP